VIGSARCVLGQQPLDLGVSEPRGHQLAGQYRHVLAPGPKHQFTDSAQQNRASFDTKQNKQKNSGKSDRLPSTGSGVEA
jgi:hypothetical protein